MTSEIIKSTSHNLIDNVLEEKLKKGSILTDKAFMTILEKRYKSK